MSIVVEALFAVALVGWLVERAVVWYATVMYP